MFVRHASELTVPGKCELGIMHGLSGSGKTVASRRIASERGAIRMTSDVERKRLYGLAPNDRSGSEIEGGIYAREATERTYARLAALAEDTIHSGFPVLVDASFLKYRHRDHFRRLAEALAVPFCIYDLSPSEEILRQRVVERQRRGATASEADLRVLKHQAATSEPLRPAERAWTRVLREFDPVS